MESWNKLPKDVQKVMDDLAMEQCQWTGEYMDNHVDESIAWSKKTQNVEVIQLPKDKKAEWDKLLEPITAKWIEDSRAKGLPAEGIVAYIKAFAKMDSGH
jgi:TRAP-type C4-dicarboxylate transport system substrate-binding protein